MRRLRPSVLAVLVGLVAVSVVCMSAVGATNYKDGENIPMYVNKVGPYSNPSETYPYYDLLYCKPITSSPELSTVGGDLVGDKLMAAPYIFKFKETVQRASICKQPVDRLSIQNLQHAIDDQYSYEMTFDGLKLLNFIGHREQTPQLEKYEYFLHNSLDFVVRYNGDQIIQIMVSVDATLQTDISLLADTEVEFSYSVTWQETDYPYSKREELLESPQPSEIHWISIFNSFVLVLLLVGFLAGALARVVTGDFKKLELEEEDTGWKLIHGDVFRLPQNKMLFCATLGAGTQLLLMTVGILVIGLLGAFPAHARGTIHLAALMLYALSAAPSSYVSSLWYKKMDGEKWWWNILLTSLMICGPFVLVLSFLNTVSIVYGTTAAVSFYGLLHMLSFSLGVALPLYMIGGIQGKNAAQPFDFPCRSLPHVREIPPLPWYRDLPVQLLFAGFLPFTGIYIELHYIYFSVWSHAVYTYYGMLSLAFTMLLAVTSLVTITFAYMQLAAEDHRWWWKSLFTGGAAGLFMLGYSCYFYFSLPMNGFLQTAFYAGYMLLAAYFTSLMLAAVGFFATFYFVLFLYNRVKDD